MIIFTQEMLRRPFILLELCKGKVQMEEHHPEGDVFTHSLQVMEWAFRETIDTDLILAALFHDVGKIEISKGHAKIGIEMLWESLSVKSLWLIEHHMRFWSLILGEMRKLSKVQELLNHPWLPDLCAIARWDKLGRNPNKRVIYDKQNIIDRLNRCVDLHFEINKNKGEKLWK